MNEQIQSHESHCPECGAPLVNGYPVDELRVDLEFVGGGGKTAKAQNLILYLDRRGYLDYLVAAVRHARPGRI